MKTVKERFLKLTSMDTRSEHDAGQIPSTASQLTMAKYLASECKAIGIEDVQCDNYGYVYGRLSANCKNSVPVVGFIAHMDTSPDYPGNDVKAKVISNYDGGDIFLNDELKLSPGEFPALKEYTGQELITTDGSTLLGADDKAGVAEILNAMEYLINNPEIKHGEIRIAFTPDEEVGHGADKFNVEEFGADFAYTMDGGHLGELEMETFNAARGRFEITGKSVHPGYAKDIMINASLIANDIINMFPANETPACTEGYEGYYHITKIDSEVSKAVVEFIIRDFSMDSFNARKSHAERVAYEINKKYGDGAVKLIMRDEYRNMYEMLKDNENIILIAKKAMANVGVTPEIKPVRGGTDGARLSFMGLPCPNIFAGGHNFHGPYEFVPVESMEKAVMVIVEICKLVSI